MKLIYQGFKITPELRNRAKFLAVKSGVNFSEWLSNAVLSQVEKEEKENVLLSSTIEKSQSN